MAESNKPFSPANLPALPAHVAIIMDGNGRWATMRGLERSAGHRAGSETVRKIVTECRSLGIKHLTLYAFSKENWSRPLEEVRFLFDMLVQFLKQELPTLLEQDISLRLFGDPSSLPLPSRKGLSYAVKKTAACESMRLNLAINYSSREEIALACRRFMESGRKAKELTPETLSEYLYSAGQPDPDLVIRTSGERRISNFLLFQCAYAEYYFTPTLWPDFTAEDLRAALADYAGRTRRFGK